MSRAAVFDALSGDSVLNDMGFNEYTILANFSGDGRPVPRGPFIIVRWEESTLYSQSYTGMNNGLNRAPRMMTIWVHYPQELTTDFGRIDTVLDRIDEVLLPMEHVDGGDGQTITCIRSSGRSRDFFDGGYSTISRNSAYGVLSRATPS